MGLSNLDDIRVFDAVARAGNLTRAARVLGLSKQTVSRRLAALEGELDVALTVRSTRAFALTGAGRNFAARCRAIVEGALDATRDLQRDGPLTVTADRVVAASILPALVSEFLVAHPDVQVIVRATDKKVDDADVAFRVGDLEGATLLGPARMITVASPGYLKGRARPSLATLDAHALIALAPTGGRAIWPIANRGVVVPLEVDARLLTESLELAHRAARAGIGLCHLPAFAVRTDLARGDLVQVLDAHAVDVGGVCAVAAHGSEAARAFVEMALTHFSAL